MSDYGGNPDRDSYYPGRPEESPEQLPPLPRRLYLCSSFVRGRGFGRLGAEYHFVPFRGLSPDSEIGEAAPQSDGLQHPDRNRNYHDNVQNRFNAGSHGDVAIDQIQRHADNDQRNHKIY
jgi:hypothetical protein